MSCFHFFLVGDSVGCMGSKGSVNVGQTLSYVIVDIASPPTGTLNLLSVQFVRGSFEESWPRKHLIVA